MTRMRSLVRIQYRPLPHFPSGHTRHHTPPKPQGFRGFVFCLRTPWDRFGALVLPDLLPLLRGNYLHPPKRPPPPGRSVHRGFAGSAGPRLQGMLQPPRQNIGLETRKAVPLEIHTYEQERRPRVSSGCGFVLRSQCPRAACWTFLPSTYVLRSRPWPHAR